MFEYPDMKEDLMERMERRDFLKAAAATAGGVALGAGGAALGVMGTPSLANAEVRDGMYRLFTPHTLPTPRPAENVEKLFHTPFPAANGMQMTSEGMWLVDGRTPDPVTDERTSHVYLLDHSGEILRSFRTEGETPSGMTHDGETLWIAATYSRDIIRADAQTGETISRHFTPGAGVIYDMPHDPTFSFGGGGGGVPGEMREGTGAHGMEVRDGKLWVAVPPSRMIYRIDPTNWVVEHQFPSVHRRPHGIGFEGDYLWESDSDVKRFYKRDIATGFVHDVIQLADDDPTPHGMSVWDGYIWWTDDVFDEPWVCRMPI